MKFSHSREISPEKTKGTMITIESHIEDLRQMREEIEASVLETLSDGGDDWFAAEKVNDCLEIIDRHIAEFVERMK